MSIKAMNWAWSISLAPTPKIVLLALCDIADDRGYCFPSVPTLAVKCTLDERTVQRVIRSLADDRYLTVEERFRRDGARTSNGYRLSLAPAPAICHPLPGTEDRGVVTALSGGPRRGCHRGGDTRAGVTTIEPTTDPTTTTTSDTDTRTKATEESGFTTRRSLRFPMNASTAQRQAMEQLCATLSDAGAQTILDELAGRMRCSHVRDPVRYCARLVDLFRRGEFRGELGGEVARRRELAQGLAITAVTEAVAEAPADRKVLDGLPEAIRVVLERARALASRGQG